jgi:integrase
VNSSIYSNNSLTGDRAMVLLDVVTGLRWSELIGLKCWM